MDKRTIDLQIDPVTLTGISETTGSKELFNAIGYLSQWNMTFPVVEIRSNGRDDIGPEIIATYRMGEGEPVGYCIAAVWHEDHFGFHS